MSLSATLVSTICQKISDLRGESSANTSANRIRFISESEQELARRMFFRIHLIKDQSLGTGDGTTSTYTIGSATYPMRMKGLTEVFVGGTTEDKRHEILDFADYKVRYNNNNSALIAYEYYDQANDLWKVKVNPVPSSGDAVTGSWYFIPPVRTLTTETVLCENPAIITHLALAKLYHSEDELQKEQLELKAAEDMIAELMGSENAPAVGQTYSMKATENTGRNRGIGSY